VFAAADLLGAHPAEGDLDGVQTIESLTGDDRVPHYAVATQSDASELAPMLARRLQEAGVSLYALTPEKRDLETVFAEVNDDN